MDSLFELAEAVRETYELREVPVERGRWMAFSFAFKLVRSKGEVLGLTPADLGLDREVFRDLPLFP